MTTISFLFSASDAHKVELILPDFERHKVDDLFHKLVRFVFFLYLTRTFVQDLATFFPHTCQSSSSSRYSAGSAGDLLGAAPVVAPPRGGAGPRPRPGARLLRTRRRARHRDARRGRRTRTGRLNDLDMPHTHTHITHTHTCVMSCVCHVCAHIYGPRARFIP